MGAVEDVVDAVSDGAASLTSRKFETAVVSVLVGWIVKNVFLDPAAWTLGIIDFAIGSALSSVERSLKTALETAGSNLAAAIIGPEGVITVLQGVAVDLATSAGIAAPLAVGLFNILLFVLVVGTIYLLGRAVAGYLTGGVLS